MGKLAAYAARHERPFALRQPNGKGVVEVRFSDGYVTIYSRQPGSGKFIQEIHITRKAWYALLNSPQLREVSRLMEGPSFDRYKAERQYFRAEAKHQAELRQMKRELRPRSRRRVKVRRRRGQA